MNSWPKSFYGKEKESGEYWTEEDVQERHSMFTDEGADLRLVDDWEILSKEKRVIYLRQAAEHISDGEWLKMYEGMKSEYTEDAWRDQYNQRVNMVNYTHIYYILRKR